MVEAHMYFPIILAISCLDMYSDTMVQSIAIFKFLPLLLREKAGKVFQYQNWFRLNRGGRFALHITRTQSLDWVNFHISNIVLLWDFQPIYTFNNFSFPHGLLWEGLLCHWLNFGHLLKVAVFSPDFSCALRIKKYFSMSRISKISQSLKILQIFCRRLSS